ncbi:MAG: glycosyltransferase family 4 protein [Acidobacteria bacterium]|nr:glycosyltransferase family 4 protein [Acidobacteriota bacterium]
MPAVKVVRILTRLGAGGPPIHALILTRGLAERGYSTLLVTGRPAPGEGDMSYLARSSDPIEWVPEMSRGISPRDDAAAFFRILAILRREKPDIVHTHTAKAGVLGRLAARAAGVPVVLHTFHGHVLDGYFPRPVSAAIALLERGLARLSSRLCVLAPQQARELSERFRVAPQARFAVVPLGLDLDQFSQLPPPPPGTPLTVGWIGRLVPVKNVPLLAQVVRETPQVRFIVAGDGPEAPAIRELAAQHPHRVEWLGWCRDIAPVLARCRLLMLTSRNEGTPVALIEGMAAGRPFIGTAAGGVTDLAAHGGGLIVSPEARAFRTALETLTPERLERMGAAARRHALSTYTADQLVHRMDTLYRGLLSGRLGQLADPLLRLELPCRIDAQEQQRAHHQAHGERDEGRVVVAGHLDDFAERQG